MKEELLTDGKQEATASLWESAIAMWNRSAEVDSSRVVFFFQTHIQSQNFVINRIWIQSHF